MAQKPQVVFVLGGPGAGKGTQCSKICNEFGFIHLSAGDLLRLERNTPGSQFGELIENHIRNGTIVPVEITCSLLEKAIQNHSIKPVEGDVPKTCGKFLIDGFPRNQNNLEGWHSQMADKVDVRFVLFLECPEDVCVERCLKRGKAGSGRSDDNEESLRKRLQTYSNDTLPIIQYYDKLQLVKKVDGSGDAGQTYQIVKRYFQQL